MSMDAGLAHLSKVVRKALLRRSHWTETRAKAQLKWGL